MKSRVDALTDALSTRLAVLDRWIGPLFFVGFILVCVYMTRGAPESWNDISRVAAIESAVERGTWAIDESAWSDETGDKAFINGRFYSDKMPLLSAAGAFVYYGVLKVSGARLAPDCAYTGHGCAYYWVTLVLMGLPAAGLLWLFYRYARSQSLPIWVAVVGTAALGFGTMVWAYALVFNSHVPAAFALFASFYLLVTKPRGVGLTVAGMFAALAASLELQAFIIAAALGLVALVRARGQIVYFILGASIPVLITIVLDYQITGTPIPPYLIPGAYAYPGSQFPNTPGGTGSPDDVYQYAFKMFLGAQGLFAYCPILFMSILGLVAVLRGRVHPLRLEAAILGLSFVALALYLVTNTGNLGGEAYGERYYVIIVPLLMAFMLFAPPFVATPARLLAVIVFAVFLALSVISANDGARRPWRYVQPPAHLTRDATSGVIGFRWNLWWR